MKFVDEIEIRVQAGHGGPGSVHFLKEKYRPHGGPDGGDGGRGGNVYLKSNPGVQTLGKFRNVRTYLADNGEPGRGNRQSGADARHLYLEAPPGTQIFNIETGEKIGELIKPGDLVLVAQGGKGGLGNQHFATSTNQAPTYAQPGIEGEEKTIKLELKLLADAGFAGKPNAGKSTLLAAITANDAKIGDYPFTTLIPGVGILEQGERRLMVADIPGIIEGAHRGAGLGLSFLRHIERVSVIVYVIDINSVDPVRDYDTLKSELSGYSEGLKKKKSMILVNKTDLIDFDRDYIEELRQRFSNEAENNSNVLIRFISATDKIGLADFIDDLFSMMPEITFAEAVLPGTVLPELNEEAEEMEEEHSH